MIKLADIYKQVRARKLTAAECVELFAHSTITEGIAHPPHPQAHISKDGFTHHKWLTEYDELHDRMIWLRARLNNKWKNRPPEYQSWKKEFQNVTAKMQKIEQNIDVSNTEGVHLDSKFATRIDKKHRLGRDYTTRTMHSQFEDTESAVMALCFALNSRAGEDALYSISQGYVFRATWNRATINSKTSVIGLSSPLKKIVSSSSHPLKGKPIRMIERGQGGAGSAPTPQASIERTVTVLQASMEGILTIVTHYPVKAWPTPPGLRGFAGNLAKHDFVEFTTTADYIRADREWRSFPVESSPQLRWENFQGSWWNNLFG